MSKHVASNLYKYDYCKNTPLFSNTLKMLHAPCISDFPVAMIKCQDENQFMEEGLFFSQFVLWLQGIAIPSLWGDGQQVDNHSFN